MASSFVVSACIAPADVTRAMASVRFASWALRSARAAAIPATSRADVSSPADARSLAAITPGLVRMSSTAAQTGPSSMSTRMLCPVPQAGSRR